MNINIKTIPHKNQVYNTCGDYTKCGKIYEYRISDLGNEYEEFLVLIHELIESFLAKKRGIEWEDITKFDLIWEKEQELCPEDEPGNCTAAPYYREHQFATGIEKILAKEFKVDWSQYNKKINNLKWQKKRKQR